MVMDLADSVTFEQTDFEKAMEELANVDISNRASGIVQEKDGRVPKGKRLRDPSTKKSRG
jgi:hypothetical protein